MVDEEIKNKEKQLLEMVGTFAEKYLDDEYKELSIKLVKKLGRKHDVPFKRGKIEIWASAVIYALGQMNFLFDKSFEPYRTPDEICDYFNTKKSTVSDKARKIRDMFKLNHFNEEFSTKMMIESNPMKDMVFKDGFIVPKSLLSDFKKEDEISPLGLITRHEDIDEKDVIKVIKKSIIEEHGDNFDINDKLNEIINFFTTPMPIDVAKKFVYALFNLDDDFDDDGLSYDDIELFDDCVIDENNPLETIDDYQRAIDLFRLSKGDEYFREHKGHFWSLHETRPFMMHLLEQSMLLWENGEKEKSVNQLKYILKLNPGDNQGIRYILINKLFELNELDEVEHLLDFFDEEYSANWEFSKLLLSIKNKQDKKIIKKLYDEAIDSNKYVVPYLINKKKIPKKLPEYYVCGDENEAIIYVDLAFKPWNDDKIANKILKEMY